MKILFITRAYPPVVGGIENHNYALSRWLPEFIDTKTVANRYGKIFLPLFLPLSTVFALFAMSRRDVLVLGDGVMAVAGWIVKTIYGRRKRVICVLHGLDITYSLPLYQRLWVKHFIPACDQLIAVSNETIRVGVQYGIPQSLFTFIPNGVDTEQFKPKDISRDKLASLLGCNIEGKFVLLTAGRLITRKGVEWFIRNVMPVLPERIIYVVSGCGPALENIRNAITETGMGARVFMLGHVSNSDREILLNTCDLFIQPNIPVAGDMEGFGLTVLEAASTGLPVIAANLEGLKDAISDHENGFLVEPLDREAFKEQIMSLREDDIARKKHTVLAREYTAKHFHWRTIAKQYVHAFKG